MNRRPSPDQLAALRGLPPGRSLLVQLHLQGKRLPLPRLPATVRLLSRAHVDLLAVGESSQIWSEIWLLEYPDSAAVEAHFCSPAMQVLCEEADDLEAVVIRPPHPRVQKVIRLLNRFLPLLPAPRRGPDIPRAELQGGINPTPAQLEAFEAADQQSPVHMFNLLKFYDTARYAKGDHGRSGRQAYERGYSRVAMSCFLRLGGRIVSVGDYCMTLVGADGDPVVDAWDEVAIVQYPNRQAFIHMLSNPAYIAALEHRHAGLARTQLWSTAPEVEYVSARHV